MQHQSHYCLAAVIDNLLTQISTPNKEEDSYLLEDKKDSRAFEGEKCEKESLSFKNEEKSIAYKERSNVHEEEESTSFEANIIVSLAGKI